MGVVTSTDQVLAVLRWPVLLVIVCAWLAMVYRYGPSRRDAKWRWVTWGSVAAAVLWLGASMLFSWYVANFDSYNKTYGSLGAGIGFMVWIWLSVVIVLLGAELNAEMEHQTARDSTDGPQAAGPARGPHGRSRWGVPCLTREGTPRPSTLKPSALAFSPKAGVRAAAPRSPAAGPGPGAPRTRPGRKGGSPRGRARTPPPAPARAPRRRSRR